ncbi:MAG: zinc-dependent alcohol dehydrogenase family protein [Hyphomicrobiales bacterium]|nr:zinc-dependent alcohol dehydrogenase family protein [Hyphomicrobiales bacterium]MCP5370289.1 zinc-dependent alcohol dehydrogenase family protein [Hyphomicrobiales bacterium]
MPRIVRYYRFGDPEELVLEEAAPAAPGLGEVRLGVLAIGINNSEAQLRRGTYPLLDPEFPTRIGKEAHGIIEALGPGVDGFAVGERVSTIPMFDMARYGVYGEWAIVPAESLVRMPVGLGAVKSAAVWQAYLTAYGPFVAYSDPAPGSWALITAASSSVGFAALQTAKARGMKAIGTTRRRDKAAGLAAAGFDRVVVTGEEPLAATVMEATGGAGAAIVFDPISGPIVAELAEAAAPGATIFEYGALAAEPTPYPLVTCLKKGLGIRGFTLWEIVRDPGRLADGKRFVVERLESGVFDPVVDRVFGLDEIAAAHRYLEAARHSGKIVVKVRDE